MNSSLEHVAPLVLVGAAFLSGMELVGREARREQPARTTQVPDATRRVVIALLLSAAVAHVPLIPEHLAEAPYMGVLFVGFTLAAFGVATALALTPSRPWYVAAGALCAAAVATYVATRLVPFPQLADDVGLWAEPLGVVSVAAETAVALICLFTLRRPTAPAPTGGRQSAQSH